MKLLESSRIATHVEFLEEAGARAPSPAGCEDSHLQSREPMRRRVPRYLRGGTNIPDTSGSITSECAPTGGRYHGEAMRQAFQYRHRQPLGVGGKNESVGTGAQFARAALIEPAWEA